MHPTSICKRFYHSTMFSFMCNFHDEKECIFNKRKMKTISNAVKICFCRVGNKNTWLLTWYEETNPMFILFHQQFSSLDIRANQIDKIEFQQFWVQLLRCNMQNRAHFTRKQQHKFHWHCHRPFLLFAVFACNVCTCFVFHSFVVIVAVKLCIFSYICLK